MSEPKRYIAKAVIRPVREDNTYDIEAVADANGDWVAWEDYSKLKSEVERLRSASFVTAVPSEQYERVVKAGDDMAAVITQYRCSPWGRKVPNAFAVWDAWFAAKGNTR